MGHGPQAGSQAVDTLAVQRVDPRRGATGPAGQIGIGRNADVVRGGVLHLGRLAIGVAVIHHAGHLVYTLVQTAAHGHVDFLVAPADAQQRHALLHAGLDERQREVVALGVEGQAGVGHGFGKVAGVDVGGRAGQHHAIDQWQQRRNLGGLHQRKQHGLCVCAHLDGPGIFVAQHQVGHLVVLAQHAVIGRQPDQGGRAIGPQRVINGQIHWEMLHNQNQCGPIVKPQLDEIQRHLWHHEGTN